MRYVKTVIAMMLLVILLTGCVETYYEKEFGHLPEYVLRDGQITMDQTTYILCEWDYFPETGSIFDTEKAICRVDDRDPVRRYNGLLVEFEAFPDRSFLNYIYEFDFGSGWGGYRALRRSDIEMPELTCENVDSIESGKLDEMKRDSTVICELFEALNNESKVLENDDCIKESEHYDNIICRNDDWPDFCYLITVRYDDDNYYAWSDFLGEDGAWISMPYDLIAEITGKDESA